jgi:uncharacterized protein
LGSGGLGLLLSLVGSRFGIVGILVLLLAYCAVSSLGGLGGGGESGQSAASKLDANTQDFLVRTLGSTEETWGEIFNKSGQRYSPTTLVAYNGGTQTACGVGQAAMGPFYCPNDRKIYIDPAFFNELSQRFGAPGDFAMTYVIAHEVGHHIQNLEGTLDRARQSQQSVGTTQGNQIQVGVELQADCYAGVWAANARDAKGSIIEPGDVEEGMRAAEAIGDDTLQKQTQGTVVPDSFTHGSSAQRMEALRRGMTSGSPAACNYAR